MPNARLTSIFEDNLGKPVSDFTGAKDEGDGVDYCSHKMHKAPVNRHHQHFYRPDALPVIQPTVSKHRRDKVPHYTDLLTPSSPGGLSSLSCSLKLLITLGEGSQPFRQPSDASTPNANNVGETKNKCNPR